MKDRKRNPLQPDFDAIPQPGVEGYADRMAEWLAGSYQSSWPVLKSATYSSALTATVGTRRVLDLLPTIDAKATCPPEGGLVLSLNYLVSILGPSLGTVMLASFATESFVRLGYATALELASGRSHADRTVGFDAVQVARLTEFDTLDAPTRVRELFRAAKIPSERQVTRPIEELIKFRNDVAHDAPAIHTRAGDLIATPTRKSANRQKRLRIGAYESIANEQRPVRLKQVCAAIAAHDNLVAHCANRSTLTSWLEVTSGIGPSLGLLIREIAPKSNWYRDVERLAKAWERVAEPMFTATVEEELAFRDTVARRVKVKLVE